MIEYARINVWPKLRHELSLNIDNQETVDKICNDNYERINKKLEAIYQDELALLISKERIKSDREKIHK